MDIRNKWMEDRNAFLRDEVSCILEAANSYMRWDEYMVCGVEQAAAVRISTGHCRIGWLTVQLRFRGGGELSWAGWNVGVLFSTLRRYYYV